VEHVWPTETTIWSSCVLVTAGDAPVSIGKPIANTQFYVLDHQDQPVPPGVAASCTLAALASPAAITIALS